MIVYKFGGASVKDEWGVKNLAEIVSRVDDRLVVVVSALGKTTNMFESVLGKLIVGDDSYLKLFNDIISYHTDLANSLFSRGEAVNLLNPMFAVTKELMLTLPGKDYDFSYDQLVSHGELYSTRIVSRWLSKSGMDSEWVDIRNHLITDSNFREANVDWDESALRISDVFSKSGNKVSVTQGFIGSNNGDTTTLGREGSDFTGAIIANICDAESFTIWKDVPGVLNADPKWIDDAHRLDNISYKEALEMSFSGAKVIHPKTIKPLHNKSIPLFVKSFLDPKDRGTVVSLDESIEQEIPVFVRKQEQVLISFIPKDFSFALCDNLGKLFDTFNRCGIKTNLVQASAVSIAVCVDYEKGRIAELRSQLSKDYKILMNEDVEMLTLRYYNSTAIKTLTAKREVLIEQRTRKSIRYIVKQ